jgi:hypothetical protein
MAKRTQTKSEFIRNNIGLSAAEIVAKAKAAGLTVTSDLVYKVKVRTKLRQRVNQAKATPVKPAPTTRAARTSKASFIRSLPASASAKDAVAAAAKRGWKIKERYVYKVRAATNRKTPKPAALRGVAGPHPKATPSSAGSASETVFRKLVLDLGLARSKALLGEVEQKLGDLIAGR